MSDPSYEDSYENGWSDGYEEGFHDGEFDIASAIKGIMTSDSNDTDKFSRLEKLYRHYA